MRRPTWQNTIARLGGLPALLLAATAAGDVHHRFTSIPIEHWVAIDIDEDGVADYHAPMQQGGFFLALKGVTWMQTIREPFAQPGASIGPTAESEYDLSALYIYSFAQLGSYEIPFGDHLVGITFPRNGALHFGWLGVSVAAGEFGGLVATVTDIAWESTPYTPILVGWGDCDVDGTGDVQQIAAGLLADCNGDFIADLCQPDEDCNGNRARDLCEIGEGTASDCNGNLVPDGCEIATDPSIDCNGDGVIDACAGDLGDADGNGVMDVCEGLTVDQDCNGNGIVDWIELQYGVTLDWTFNGVPDECDFAANPGLDCDGNGVADAFNLEFQPWLDCNGDGVIDACQGLDPAQDCNGNGIADACEPPAPPASPTPESADCDGNGRFDVCDIADGVVADCDGNGVPDTCDNSGPMGAGIAALALPASGAAAVVPGMGLAMPGSEITIEFWQWVDVDQNQVSFQVGLDATNGCFAQVPVQGGDIRWCFGDSTLWCIPPYSIVGAWHHVAFQASASGEFMAIYLDGRLESASTWMDTLEPADRPLVFGGPSWHPFTGRIDEFRIWDHARSPAQIAEHMQGQVDPSSPGLVGYWRFDEASGAIAADLAGGRNAQLVDGATWAVPALCPPSPDLDGDGAVDGADVGLLLAAWGAAEPGAAADLDRDGIVGSADLGLLLAAWE